MVDAHLVARRRCFDRRECAAASAKVGMTMDHGTARPISYLQKPGGLLASVEFLIRRFSPTDDVMTHLGKRI